MYQTFSTISTSLSRTPSVPQQGALLSPLAPEFAPIATTPTARGYPRSPYGQQYPALLQQPYYAPISYSRSQSTPSPSSYPPSSTYLPLIRDTSAPSTYPPSYPPSYPPTRDTFVSSTSSTYPPSRSPSTYPPSSSSTTSSTFYPSFPPEEKSQIVDILATYLPYREDTEYKKIAYRIRKYVEAKERLDTPWKKFLSSLITDYKFPTVITSIPFKMEEGIKEIGYRWAPDCWGNFIDQALFARYTYENTRWRNVFYLLPERDKMWKTTDMLNQSNPPKEIYEIGFDMRNNFIFLILNRVLMLDFDFKEGISPNVIVSLLLSTVSRAAQYGIKLAFMLFGTDRGIHAFLVSKDIPPDEENVTDVSSREPLNRRLSTIDFMTRMLTDPFYSAFVYNISFAVRVGKKENKPDDIVGRVGVGSVPEAKLKAVDEKQNNIQFASKYFSASFPLYVFRYDDPTSYQLIGDRGDVNTNLFTDVLFHYLLIQYFRNVSEPKSLRCSIHNKALGIGNGSKSVGDETTSGGSFTKDETGSVSNGTKVDDMREDIAKLREVSITCSMGGLDHCSIESVHPSTLSATPPLSKEIIIGPEIKISSPTTGEIVDISFSPAAARGQSPSPPQSPLLSQPSSPSSPSSSESVPSFSLFSRPVQSTQISSPTPPLSTDVFRSVSTSLPQDPRLLSGGLTQSSPSKLSTSFFG